ncbi:dipeptidyl peptidase 2 [Lampetra planeri]
MMMAAMLTTTTTMILPLLLCALSACALPAGAAALPFPGSSVQLQVRYFDQILDHFNFNSQGDKTYKQRYLVSDQYWEKGVGPIFFYTGNEGDIWAFANNTGFMIELAPEFKALIVFAEHRYYGESLPFGKDSFRLDTIGLLTIEQALADFAVLLDSIKQNFGAQMSKVVSFGGSYGGMLSAYFRMHYPHLVDAALAASAPIPFVSGQGDPLQFFRDVTADFEKYNPKCPDIVRAGFIELKKLADKQEWAQIAQRMRLCQAPGSAADVRHMYGWARNTFTYLAMLDYPYAASFMGSLPANPVNVACDLLLNSKDPLDGLTQAVALFYNTSGTAKCLDPAAEFIECADPTGCGLGPDSLAWDYQACTEINLLCSTNNVSDMFPALPYTAAARRDYCAKRWGVVPRETWLATQYWGKDVNSSSQIIFSNGNLDPWGNGGFQQDVGGNVAVKVIGGAHHLDLRYSNPADPESVVTARKLESGLLHTWLAV